MLLPRRRRRVARGPEARRSCGTSATGAPAGSRAACSGGSSSHRRWSTSRTLLLLDEPTAGIDPLLRNSIWEELDRLKAAGRTLLVTTQYVTEAEQCDAVALIAGGRLIALGTPSELRRRAGGGDVVEVETEAPFDPEPLTGRDGTSARSAAPARAGSSRRRRRRNGHTRAGRADRGRRGTSDRRPRGPPHVRRGVHEARRGRPGGRDGDGHGGRRPTAAAGDATAERGMSRLLSPFVYAREERHPAARLRRPRAGRGPPPAGRARLARVRPVPRDGRVRDRVQRLPQAAVRRSS